MRSRTIVLVTSAVAAGLLSAGCSSGDSASDQPASSMAGGAAAPEKAAPGKAAPEKAAPEAAPDQAKAEVKEVLGQRSIIYRGTVSVRVESVEAAAGQATGIAQTFGGFVGGDNRSSGDGAAATATMELRVPADKFAATVDRLSRLGKESRREISTEDVTEQTVDLDARITVQQARVDSGRKLLAQAKTLNDLVMLEKEVATRESDLASLQAKKRRLADLTALSTITVTFLGPAAPAPRAPKAEPPGFLSGLAAGWHSLLGSLRVLLTVLGALLPWLLVLGIPMWAGFYGYRRFVRGRRVKAGA